jgi:nitroreductase
MSYLEELVRKNRSYRGYDESVSVTSEQLYRLLSCVRLTPSSTNLQPLKFLVTNTPEENAKIFPYTKWAGKLSHLHLPYEGHRPTAYVVIFIDRTIAQNPTPFLKDVGIAAQTLLLGAVEQGLGGIMIGSFDHDAILKEFSLPDTLQPELVVALGKPDETIVLEDAEGGEVSYYRDAQDVHHVPKRPLEELILDLGKMNK